ncbi:OB-fold protein [Niabella soli]|uniref:tRNA_anti-like n=1 Tax=Niabella soli DSM 19437 TaxID=929713 RepID=W0F8J6_9BACT|nr:hypothetical protein [Niabella soli]AHF17779.1 hypothetical protein NIASO_14045 [Niabella soli DSM 19437]
MKRRIKILLLVIIAMAGVLYGLYWYYKKPEDIRSAVPQLESTAAGIIADFNNDEQVATKKYVDKVILINGKVTDIKVEQNGTATVFLDGNDPLASVTCSFYNNEAGNLKTIKPGAMVKIKGVCTGKLMDVVFNKCSIVP